MPPPTRTALLRSVYARLNELPPTSLPSLWIATLVTRKAELEGAGETEEQAIGALYSAIHAYAPRGMDYVSADIQTRRIVSGECYIDREPVNLNSTKGSS